MLPSTAPVRLARALSAFLLAGLGVAAPLLAASGAVTVAVDPNADRHPISPLVYGVNFDSDGQEARLHLALRRWGGTPTHSYS
jgi:hypothetical protein